MVFTRLISTTLAVSGLTGALAAPVETNADSFDAPRVLTEVPERTGDERRRMEDGELAYTWDLTNEQKQMFVDRHNYWRNRAALGELNSGKKAAKMPQMYWDEELAEHAKQFSRKCIWEHSSMVGWREVDYAYGENLYTTSADAEYDDRYIQSSMDNWAYEHEYYNHDTLSCSREPCGHYTAMVWEHTTRVGCAVAKCDSVSGIGWSGHYVICQYYRGGNYRNQDPYEYSLTSTTGDGCSSAPYGGSTGMDSQWTGLCNNQNDICTDNNRCSAMQTCSSGSPLNGVDIEYTCSTPVCHYDEYPGYQVDDAYNHMNGMSGENGWAYFQSRQLCEDWCYLNKDANPGCMGCTQQSNQHPSLWFALRTVDESVRSTVGTAYILLVLDCSSPGVNPTPRPTSPPVDNPTSPPAVDPTLPPAIDPTVPVPTEDPTDEPTADYECTEVTIQGTEMRDACAADTVIVVDGFWQLCRETPVDCIEWCKANRDTYGCLGVSSDDRNPGFYFPVRNIDTDDRVPRDGAVLILMDCVDAGSTRAPTAPPTEDPTQDPNSPTSPPTTADPTSTPTEAPTNRLPTMPTAKPTYGELDYECSTETIQGTEMADACAADTVIVVDGGWQLCRDTPDDCIEWCKHNFYTYGCVGVSSDDRNPGFYFPVRQTDASDRVPRDGAILILMECNGSPTNPTNPPALPTGVPTEEPTDVPSAEPTADSTSAPTQTPTLPPVTDEPTPAPVTDEPTPAPTAEPTAVPAPTQEPEEFVCTTVTVPNVEIPDAVPSRNGLRDSDGNWEMCRGNPDDCVEWCKENRFTAPCLGVTSDASNPNFFFPVKTVASEVMESVDGGFVIVMECTGGSLPPTPAPTNYPTVEGSAKFDIGSCDHLELTEGGNCVATKVYGNNHDCEITVLGDFVLDVRDWDVESNSSCRYDYLKLPNGDKFCTNSPQGHSVSNGQRMEWHTDSSVTEDGWEMCAGSRRRQGEQEAVLRRLA